MAAHDTTAGAVVLDRTGVRAAVLAAAARAALRPAGGRWARASGREPARFG
ncbi:hypothetical protein ABT263_08105 [Kitasatospora sp. NPDC001603]|uniref:hypothetical protein n=1 Tax=Kitasatospora sp. NPDC001603 TaxID=3154388 RepID=UPI0033227318